MYRKVLIGGIAAAAIVGAGGTALATTASGSTSGSPSGSPSSSAHAHGDQHGKHGRRLLRRLVHGQFVTRARGDFVTHDIIRGTVTAVSPTSITVKAKDDTSETFRVTKDTKVRHRVMGPKAKPSTWSIDKVSKGDMAGVAGVGTSTFTARHIADITTK